VEEGLLGLVPFVPFVPVDGETNLRRRGDTPNA
jgi:hypothetical protein